MQKHPDRPQFTAPDADPGFYAPRRLPDAPEFSPGEISNGEISNGEISNGEASPSPSGLIGLSHLVGLVEKTRRSVDQARAELTAALGEPGTSLIDRATRHYIGAAHDYREAQRRALAAPPDQPPSTPPHTSSPQTQGPEAGTIEISIMTGVS